MNKFISKLALSVLMAVVPSLKASAQNVSDSGELTSWLNPPSNIIMPDNVIKISDNCFCGYEADGWDESYYPNPDITTVDFCNTQIIGKQAFYMLPKLRDIKAALYVREIGKQAFSECNSLLSVSLPSIEILHQEAFANCQFLNSIHLGKDLKLVESKVFKNCPELASLTMDEGGQHFYAKDNVLVSKDDGKIMGCAGNVTEVNIDGVKIASEYVFQNNTNLQKVVLNDLVELEDGAFCGCSNLTELYIPKLTTLPSWGYMVFSGCSSLRLLDIHESTDFQGFGSSSVPDKKGLRIYVANDVVKQRIESDFKDAEIIVGAPEGGVEKYTVTYTYNAEGGAMDVWGSGAVDVPSGSELPAHSMVTFKAIPSADYVIGSFVVNGEEKIDQIEMFYGEGKYVVDDITSNCDVKVTFVEDAAGDLIFFGPTPVNAGTLTCKLEDGTPVQSATKVPCSSKLFFEAAPTLAGFHIDTWAKDEGSQDINYVPIPGQDGKSTFQCFSEPGLDIRVVFAMNADHKIFEFKNQNENTGKISAFINGAEIDCLGAYPAGSVITLTMTPADATVNCIKWFDVTKDDFVEIKEFRNKEQIEITLTDNRYISALCCHEEEPAPGEHDPVIVDGHLISWNAIGSVVLPDEVFYIDAEAFRGAMELEAITLNDNVKYIGELPFLMCPELNSITVPETNPCFKSVNGILYSKDGSTLVCFPGGIIDSQYTLPAEVTNVVPGAFISTPRLKTIKVEAGNTAYQVIGNALVRTADMTMVYYPNAAFMVEEEPKLVIDEQIEAVGRYALAYIPALTVLELHPGFKRFEACACIAAGGLSRFSTPENVDIKDIALEEIGDSAFFNSMNLERLPYLRNLKRIGAYAFADGFNLQEVHIPANCQIGERAFYQALAIVCVLCYGHEPSAINDETFYGLMNVDETVLAVPVGCVDKYAGAEGWKNFLNIMEFDADVVTGIKNVNSSDVCDDAYYTLSGMKVQNPVKNGLYIHNGKKIIY